MVETLALFDLDSTLLEGDCEWTWCEHLRSQGIVGAAFMARFKAYCAEYELGMIHFEEYERYILSPVAGQLPAQVQQILGDYLQKITRLIRPGMQSVLAGHRGEGHTLLLATASNSFLAEPIASLLGIQQVVSTRCELVEGVPSGKLIGETAFREGKVAAVQNWVEAHGASLTGSWGYSDSHNDLPFLRLVEHPVAVTPDARLRRVARQNGWPILDVHAQAL